MTTITHHALVRNPFAHWEIIRLGGMIDDLAFTVLACPDRHCTPTALDYNGNRQKQVEIQTLYPIGTRLDLQAVILISPDMEIID